jgi:predicted GNAT family acetyltransferase
VPYELREYSDPKAFCDATMGDLVRREAECCAQIGLINRMVRDGYSPISDDEMDRPILWTIHAGGEVEVVVVQTLKKRMIVTRGSAEAMAFLAGEMVSRQWPGSSFVGVTPSVELLADRYATLTRRTRTLAIRLRVFQLDRVIRPLPAPGKMRLGEPADRKLLAHSIEAFERDIGDHSLEDPYVRAGRMIDDRRIFFWVNPEPVAMAAWAGPTPNGIRVNFVYTPDEFRGRGYASNLVATLSQHLLDQGRKFCFLFTDQANPTSNRIYQKIGYRAVSDSERWEFT